MSTKQLGDAEYLVNQSTHTCLTVLKGTGIHDAVIGLAKCSGDPKQQWYIQNGQWLWGGNQSLCLSVKSNSGDLCLAYVDSVNKLWKHDEHDRLVLGSLALDVPWQNPRTKVILYPTHTGVNQKWWTLSQLKECLEDDCFPGDHCLASPILEICKKSTAGNECYCQVGSDFTMVSHTGEVISSSKMTIDSEYLINQSTLTSLTVLNGTTSSDALVGLAPFTGGLNQQWLIKGNHWIWAGNQSLCLSPNWEHGSLGLDEISKNQTPLKFDNEGLLKINSYALDVPWETPRTKVILYPSHGGKNQKWWKLSQVRCIIKGNSANEKKFPKELVKMLDVPVVSYEDKSCNCHCKGKDAQDASDKQVEYLISQSTHTCLTVLSGMSPSDAVIGLAPYSGEPKQQWFIRDGVWHWGGNHSFCLAPDFNKNCLRLTSKADENAKWKFDRTGLLMNGSYVLDVPWEGVRTKVILYGKHNGINQKWFMLSQLKSCIGKKLYPFSSQDKKVYMQEMARGIVNRLCSLSEPLPHPRAVNSYPGTADVTTPRISLSCALNVCTIKQSENLRMTVPEDWQATNMYVVAGELFTIKLPNNLTAEQAEQITVRVGAHRDCLHPESPNLKGGVFKRLPVVSEEFDVKPGINKLRSQFGGNLIFTYEGNDTFSTTAEVENVIETPHFKLGKINMTDWEKMKRLDAPFCVLETSKVVLIVPTKEARMISDLPALLHRYDHIMTMLEDLAGFTKEDPPPKGKQWLVDDIQIVAGSAHAGFPAMFDHQYYSLTSPLTPHDWVVWHELGHNYQQGDFWSYAYGSESTVNLFSLYIEEVLKSDDRLKRENRYLPTAKAVDSGLTFEAADCWQKLVFLMEIKHAFPNHGWDMYRHLNRSVRALPKSESRVLRSNQQNQYDYFYSAISRFIGFDLLPHYQRWRLPLSQKIKDEIRSLKLPQVPRNLSGTLPK